MPLLQRFLEKYAGGQTQREIRLLSLRSEIRERDWAYQDGQRRLSEARRTLKSCPPSPSRSGLEAAEVTRLIQAGLAEVEKRLERSLNQVYGDLQEALPPLIRRELRRNGGVN